MEKRNPDIGFPYQSSTPVVDLSGVKLLSDLLLYLSMVDIYITIFSIEKGYILRG